MKNPFVASPVAVALLAVPVVSSAAASEAQWPIRPNAEQMNSVTAGRSFFSSNIWQSFFAAYKHAETTQLDIFLVTIIQIRSNNAAVVISGNFASIIQ